MPTSGSNWFVTLQSNHAPDPLYSLGTGEDFRMPISSLDPGVIDTTSQGLLPRRVGDANANHQQGRRARRYGRKNPHDDHDLQILRDSIDSADFWSCGWGRKFLAACTSEWRRSTRYRLIRIIETWCVLRKWFGHTDWQQITPTTKTELITISS